MEYHSRAGGGAHVMVDYSMSDEPEVLVSKYGGPFKMEELAVMALLECPVCLERLDVTAKVLPCQHTFCMSCLQRQEAAHSQLFCPECRTLAAPARTVEELPANLLLVRLLEGLQGSAGPGRSVQSARYAVPLGRASLKARENQQQQQQQQQQQESHHRDKQGQNEPALRAPMYNQRGDVSGELALMPGNSITTKHKADDNWRYEDSCDSSGASVTALQAVSQAPQLQPLQQSQPSALCRALCDFNPEDLNLEDSKYCLSFLKGDILTVIRRVDEHWVEAKLGEKVGICPQQFVEPNAAASKLLKGKSRRGGESAEFHHQPGSGGKDKATDAPNRTAHYGVPLVPAKTPIINALPLSSQRKPTAAGSSNLYQTTSGEAPNVNSYNHRGQPQRLSLHSATQGHSHRSRVNSHRIRRHSDPHRHLLHSQKKMASETPPTISMALNPQMPSASADSKNSSTQQLSISVCAVLYSYKPRRPEELELRKGEMVGVYGQFKEGWLRGLSLRTGKVGILPSNYITPVLRTSARLLETKAASASSHYNTVDGKKSTAAKNPAVVLALDRVNSDGAIYSTGQVPSVPNGAQHAMSSAGSGKPSFYGGSQGWESVRRIFNPHRGSNRLSHVSHVNVPSNSQHFAQVQTSGYSPALQRKKNSSILPSGRLLGWMTEPAAPSTAAFMKDRDFTASHEATFHQDRQPSNGPQSILVRPDTHKNNTDKPAKSVRFLTDEDSPLPRRRTSSWSSGNQVPSSNSRPGPPPLEVWAPSLTLGRDGPGIILKEGKGPIIRKGLETAISDLNSNPQRPVSSQPPLSAGAAQFSPSRHRVTTTHLAQTDSEISLLQGELVLVHRPRPDGRVLVTQESSGQTGLFHTSVLQSLERLS